jgi:hypothetical protein
MGGLKIPEFLYNVWYVNQMKNSATNFLTNSEGTLFQNNSTFFKQTSNSIKLIPTYPTYKNINCQQLKNNL